MEKGKTITKFIFVVIVSFIWFNLLIIINNLAASTTEGFNRLMLLLYAQWVLPIAILVLARRDKINSEELGFTKKITIQHILLGFLVGGLLHILNSIVMLITTYLTSGSAVLSLTSPDWGIIVLTIVYNFFGVAVNEELFFRGYLSALLRKYPGIPRIAQIFITSFIFGAFHLVNLSLLSACRAFAIGMVLASLMVYSKRFTLLSAIIAHATYNSLTFVIPYTVS